MLPLEAIRVIDLGRGFPGAYTAMFLADFGAEVIRIDPPASILSFPDPVPEVSEEKFAAYFAWHRNKKSIMVNLQHEEGRQLFYRLVQNADVLIEGFRPGVMKRLKADYETLKGINNRLVYCGLYGYGSDGPYASRPGHDMNYTAMAGALSMIGEPGGRPYFPSNYLADMGGAGLHGLAGILIALLHRERTGEGQFVDISYLDTVLSLMSADISIHLLTGKVPKRGETRATGCLPSVQIYRCKDGEYVTLGCLEPVFWANFCHAVGREDLVDYHNPVPEKREQVADAVAQIFLARTRDEWEEFLKDKQTCFSPVNYVDEALSNPQVRHRKMIIETDHPRLGKVKQMGFPIKLSQTPARLRSLGTPAGTDTEQVLTTLGYSEEEVRRLRDLGAIG